MKSIQVFLNKFLVGAVQTESDFPFSNLLKIITLDNRTDVNNVITKPIINVTANPLIGPVPKM